MFHVPSLHVKYIINLVQNTLVYIKCIGQPRKATKLQPNLWLNKHNGFLVEKPNILVNRKDVQFSNRTIVAKIVRKLKRWLLIIKIINHNCKWQIVTCSHKLDGYI